MLTMWKFLFTALCRQRKHPRLQDFILKYQVVHTLVKWLRQWSYTFWPSHHINIKPERSKKIKCTGTCPHPHKCTELWLLTPGQQLCNCQTIWGSKRGRPQFCITCWIKPQAKTASEQLVPKQLPTSSLFLCW
jgi:hypothetical protein